MYDYSRYGASFLVGSSNFDAWLVRFQTVARFKGLLMLLMGTETLLLKPDLNQYLANWNFRRLAEKATEKTAAITVSDICRLYATRLTEFNRQLERTQDALELLIASLAERLRLDYMRYTDPIQAFDAIKRDHATSSAPTPQPDKLASHIATPDHTGHSSTGALDFDTASNASKRRYKKRFLSRSTNDNYCRRCRVPGHVDSDCWVKHPELRLRGKKRGKRHTAWEVADARSSSGVVESNFPESASPAHNGEKRVLYNARGKPGAYDGSARSRSVRDEAAEIYNLLEFDYKDGETARKMAQDVRYMCGE